MTLVDRHTSCIVAWAVGTERSEAVLQALVDQAPPAQFYYSDLFATYRALLYTPGIHTPRPDKSETYRVEGDNAELRHYLARLVRKSRCFSRCIAALRRAVKLFVFAWNRRQLYHQQFPKYPAHVSDFACPCVHHSLGEASLYAPELAALAIAQTGGDLYEAVLVLRAYRSTQPRLAYAKPISPHSMLTVRRISAAFKDIPGGQVLGPTLDYSHRILRLDILDGTSAATEAPEAETEDLPDTPAEPSYPLLADWQRQNGLLNPLPETKPIDAADIPDVTRDPIMVPAPRAHRLQALARADTGGVLALGYSSMRGYGLIHPTVNELRLAHAEVMVKHPVTGAEFSAGRVRVSQAEVVSKDAAGYQIGFAATLGWNEVKLIAASTLDMEMNNANSHPALSEDFVLYHTEPVESSGFCIHFKLPHYVTFASSMDAVRAVQALYGGAKSTAAETTEEPS